MPPMIPPHITPPKQVKVNLALLKQTADCIINTWPERMYRSHYHAAPVRGVHYFMQPDAISDVLLNRAGLFEQSHLTRRILRPIWRTGLTAADTPSWRAQRRAASPVFTPSSVEAIIPTAMRTVQTLCTNWRKQEQCVEITSGLGNAAQQVVMESLLGELLTEETRIRLQELGASLISEMGRINYADLLMLPEWMRRFLGPTFHATSQHLHSEIARHLKTRDQAQGAHAPLLEHLMTSKDPESGAPISLEQLRHNLVGFIGAGRETTALSIAWSMMLLAHDPEAQSRVHDEVDGISEITPNTLKGLGFTRAVLLEAMRLYPPAPQIARDSVKETKIAGVQIRRGDLVNIPIYVVHRHRALWSQPDAFIPDRFLTMSLPPKELRWRYLPFGGGAHICLGQAFAMTEATVMLAEIIRNFRISVPPDWTLDFETGASLRPKGGVRLRLTPR